MLWFARPSNVPTVKDKRNRPNSNSISSPAAAVTAFNRRAAHRILVVRCRYHHGGVRRRQRIFHAANQPCQFRIIRKGSFYQRIPNVVAVYTGEYIGAPSCASSFFPSLLLTFFFVVYLHLFISSFHCLLPKMLRILSSFWAFFRCSLFAVVEHLFSLHSTPSDRPMACISRYLLSSRVYWPVQAFHWRLRQQTSSNMKG